MTSYRLARIIGSISRDVYTIKSIPQGERLAAARRAGQVLHDWRECLPPHLGTIKPSSLIPGFRRQSTALRLAYSHAIIHANRPFLLGNGGALENENENENEAAAIAAAESVSECIMAAKVILETVDGMADDGTLFHALWWTPYVTFCALAVVYVWEIQRNKSRYASRVVPDPNLWSLADMCRAHLARATWADSPNQRYSIILEELRMEARQHSARPTGNSYRCCDKKTGGHVNAPAQVQFPAQGLERGPYVSMQQQKQQQQQPPPPALPQQQLLLLQQQQQIQQQRLQSQSHTQSPPSILPQSRLAGETGDVAMIANGSLLDRWQMTDWLDLDSSVSFLKKPLFYFVYFFYPSPPFFSLHTKTTWRL